MKLAPALALLLVSITSHAQKPAQAPKNWTVEDIFRDGGPTGTPPHGIEWSPDGKLLTFLAPDNTVGKQGDLLALDTATNKITVLASADKLTSAAISEKDKDHRARYGMPSYTWAADSKHLILDSGGVISLYDITTQTATRVVDTHSGSGDDAKFSPDAKSISWVRDHNLYVASVKSGSELNLTRTEGDALLNGEVDWVYLEELDVRSNYFWSPDSQHIAYLQADESKVPQYPLTDLSGTHATVDMQRYPQPGDPNPSVRVGIVSANGSKTKWLDIPQIPGDDYIPRFGWIDSKTLYIEVLTRSQKSLSIYLADANSGKTHLILTDYDSKYLDTNYDIFPLGEQSNGDQPFLFLSWRDGHAHIYEYNYPKHPLEDIPLVQITSGDFDVQQFLGFDPKSHIAFYLSNEGNPLENALWSISLADGKLTERKLTSTPGSHYISLSPDFKHFVDMSSSTLHPYNVSLCDLAQQCTSIWKSKTLADLGYTPIAPQTLQLKAADKTTTLYATLVLPSNIPAGEKIPLILNPYGGPHEQSVTDAWGGSAQLFDQLLAQHGFATLYVDNRGMGGRGRDFEQAAYGNFGPVQLEDQLAALDQVLALYPTINEKKIGFWGWSWGGTFTLYAMEHSDRFKAGIAVAPVTDWRLYDSIYTERYLGLPTDNGKIYDLNSTVKSAAQLHGKLLLIHGTGDDNVHVANSLQQQQAFIDAQLPFDLELYPGKTHSISGYTARVNLFNHVLQYFETNLK